MGAPGPIADRPTPSALVETACDPLFERSQAARYGLSRKDFGVILLSIAKQYCAEAVEAELVRFLESLKLEELALARESWRKTAETGIGFPSLTKAVGVVVLRRPCCAGRHRLGLPGVLVLGRPCWGWRVCW